MPGDGHRVVVRKDGPYRVEGGVPLLRTAIVRTERGDPVDWQEGPAFEVPETYELCRCGRSSTKPFCDSTHEREPFDGTEVADRAPSAERRSAFEGDGVVLYDDLSLCAHHAFCTALDTTVWDLVEETEDEDQEQLIARVSRCPSGRLVVRVGADEVEPGFEPSIGVEPDGSLWVRGKIPIVSEDGEPYEIRNRVTVCRCGRSRNKPFCDGSHKRVGFSDPALPV